MGPCSPTLCYQPHWGAGAESVISCSTTNPGEALAHASVVMPPVPGKEEQGRMAHPRSLPAPLPGPQMIASNQTVLPSCGAAMSSPVALTGKGSRGLLQCPRRKQGTKTVQGWSSCGTGSNDQAA